MIDRCVEKAAVLLIDEAREDLIDERASGIEISTIVESFICQRESPGSAGVILQQPIDVSMSDDAVVLRCPIKHDRILLTGQSYVLHPHDIDLQPAP